MMAKPGQGMRETQIHISGNLAREFEMPADTEGNAFVDSESKNGRIVNDGQSGPFNGHVVWNFTKDPAIGKRSIQNILSLDSAYWQVTQIFNNAMDEAGRIAGPNVDAHAKGPGELAELARNRQLLGEWNDLTGS